MPGYKHELAQARREGVRLVERAVPQEFVRGAGGGLTTIRLADGRTLPCDLALVAIGQARLRELARALPGIEVDAAGRLVADPAGGRTGHPKVFAGGDAVSGGDLVVTVAQAAKRAARAICAQCGVTPAPDSPVLAGHE